MTDLNPTPNDTFAISGILGFGDLGVGVVLVIIGLLADIAPLMWVGVGLFVCGAALAVATSRSRR